ncbi:MAG: phosphoribosylamine--glycine ligase [Robiginitomaculum sp.]|nr:phosphoribosylamine--glycine ligase [Robiginitomaculum sp.]
MKIMLVGTGGREHALAWKMAQSPLLAELVLAPGNDAMEKLASNNLAISRQPETSADDVEALVELAKSCKPDLVVIGPENALAGGLADKLNDLGINVFGPNAAAARLESSKAFTKDFCQRHNIPAARSKTVSSENEANDYLETLSAPYVLKADGLAAGKGVVITEDLIEAKASAKQMLDGQFGEASSKLVIEEFLTGEEASLFVLCDGKTAVPMVGAQDHKRAFDGDTGPNTGGMGCYSPAPILDDEMTDKVMQQIVKPTLAGMVEQGTPFSGVLYAGLMIDNNQPKLIEYNVRFGDPECQVLMLRLQSDLIPALMACATEGLATMEPLSWDQRSAACVVMAANGYPRTVSKGSIITGIEQASISPAVKVFHAGTKISVNGEVSANGGRVLNIAASGEDLSQAVANCYAGVEQVNWSQGFYRRDIGWRALGK